MSNFFKLYLIMFLFWGGGSVIGFAFGSSNLSHFITNISICFQIMRFFFWIEFSQQDWKLNLGGVGSVIQYRRVKKKKEEERKEGGFLEGFSNCIFCSLSFGFFFPPLSSLKPSCLSERVEDLFFDQVLGEGVGVKKRMQKGRGSELGKRAIRWREKGVDLLVSLIVYITR